MPESVGYFGDGPARPSGPKKSATLAAQSGEIGDGKSKHPEACWYIGGHHPKSRKLAFAAAPATLAKRILAAAQLPRLPLRANGNSACAYLSRAAAPALPLRQRAA